MQNEEEKQNQEVSFQEQELSDFYKFHTSNSLYSRYNMTDEQNSTGYIPFTADENYSTKLTSLLGYQSSLQTEFDSLRGATTEISADLSSYYVGNVIGLTGRDLERVGVVALNSEWLNERPTYDLVRYPEAATLNIAADTIATSQNYLSLALDNYAATTEFSSAWGHAGTISTLNQIALETYKTTDEKVEEVKEEVEKISLEIEEIKLQRRRSEISDAEEKISRMLGEIDPELEKKFRGAAQAIQNENEDYVAQSAESLTRVIEKLPYYLGATKDKNIKKEDQIKRGLAEYLQVEEGHYLVIQQPVFYSTLGGIRHGNEVIYPMYNNDKPRYKTLVLQIEAYIYSILTFNNKDD